MLSVMKAGPVPHVQPFFVLIIAMEGEHALMVLASVTRDSLGKSAKRLSAKMPAPKTENAWVPANANARRALLVMTVLSVTFLTGRFTKTELSNANRDGLALHVIRSSARMIAI